jgi:hypothetical protein
MDRTKMQPLRKRFRWVSVGVSECLKLSRLWCRLEDKIYLFESGERAPVIALQGRRNHALGSGTKPWGQMHADGRAECVGACKK